MGGGGGQGKRVPHSEVSEGSRSRAPCSSLQPGRRVQVGVERLWRNEAGPGAGPDCKGLKAVLQSREVFLRTPGSLPGDPGWEHPRDLPSCVSALRAWGSLPPHLPARRPACPVPLQPGQAPTAWGAWEGAGVPGMQVRRCADDHEDGAGPGLLRVPH